MLERRHTATTTKTCHLRKLQPGKQVNTTYITSTSRASSPTFQASHALVDRIIAGIAVYLLPIEEQEGQTDLLEASR